MIKDCCSQQPDFIISELPILESVFRILLTSGNQPKLLRGWHRQLNLHAAGFLDGSARYSYYDTRYVDGPGWTTWPKRPWTYGWEEYNDR